MDSQTEKLLKSWLWQRYHAKFLSSNELSYMLLLIDTLQNSLGLPHKRPLNNSNNNETLSYLRQM